MTETALEACWEHTAGARRAAIALDPDSLSVRALTRALCDLVGRLPPDRKLLRKVLHCQDVQLLEALFGHHGTSPFQDIQADTYRAVAINDLYLQGRVDLLSRMRDAGLCVSWYSDTLLTILCTRSDDPTLRFALEQDGLRIRLLGDCLTTLIQEADAERAPAIVALFQNPSDVEAARLRVHLARKVARSFSLKPFAFLLRTGADPDALVPVFSETLPLPRLRDLSSRAASAHGRIELGVREPSVEDLLARDARTGRFFGMTQAWIDARMKRTRT